MVQEAVTREIYTNINLEKRFNNLENGQAQLVELVRTLETNIIVYREDTKDFMHKICKENENFRQEMRESFEKFRLDIDKRFESIDKRFESIDKRFESIEEKFDRRFDSIDKKFDSIDKKFDSIDKKFDLIDKKFDLINQQFIEVHKAINRMTVFFIGSMGTIVLFSKLIDKIWS